MIYYLPTIESNQEGYEHLAELAKATGKLRASRMLRRPAERLRIRPKFTSNRLSKAGVLLSAGRLGLRRTSAPVEVTNLLFRIRPTRVTVAHRVGPAASLIATSIRSASESRGLRTSVVPPSMTCK